MNILSILALLGGVALFLFGMHADEVVRVRQQGYMPQIHYAQNYNLRRVIEGEDIGTLVHN